MGAVMEPDCRAGLGLSHFRVHSTHRRDIDQCTLHFRKSTFQRKGNEREVCQVRFLGYKQHWWLSSLREGNVLEGCWWLAVSVWSWRNRQAGTKGAQRSAAVTVLWSVNTHNLVSWGRTTSSLPSMFTAPFQHRKAWSWPCLVFSIRALTSPAHMGDSFHTRGNCVARRKCRWMMDNQNEKWPFQADSEKHNSDVKTR